MSRKKKPRKLQYRDIDLNVMPFIDVFSMLNSFLLYSAVFLAIGIIEVQIPFLSNAAPPTKETRVFNVNVDILKEGKVEVTTTWSQPPDNTQKNSYEITDQGMNELHAKMVQIRKENIETDKLTVFSDDEVIYDKISRVLDTIKLRRDADPQLLTKDEIAKGVRVTEFIFPKVIMGSVMLKGG